MELRQLNGSSWTPKEAVVVAAAAAGISNRRVGDTAFYMLIASYGTLIIFGTLGNILVSFAVIRKPAMRTVRHAFIFNLAVSDLLLCLVTMPLTLMELLSKTWPLGNSEIPCKMVGSLQAVSIFASTLSITAIALDRYQTIVRPTQEVFTRTTASLAIICIWCLSVILAAPLFVWRELEHVEIPVANSPIPAVDYCIESWPSQHGRVLYSAASIIIQYTLPIITVSLAHRRIGEKLRTRLVSLSANDTKKQQHDQRLRKTLHLLMAVTMIFAVCWMPINIFNIVVDAYNIFGEDTESMYIAYGCCHMVGMSSACANPLLYGWLNDNFRKEFKEIFAACACFKRVDSRSNNNGRSGMDGTSVAIGNRTAVSGNTAVAARTLCAPSDANVVTTATVIATPVTGAIESPATAVDCV